MTPNMKKIVAIGGGEIGRPGTRIETESIDKEIIKLSGKAHPRLLFLPTASGDSSGYVEVVKNYFGKRLGCRVGALLLKRKKYSKKEIEKQIFSSDIIYVGGGNTLKMMKIWRKLGVDKILKKASEKGIVLSGVSAGSICWFRHGQSDSWKMANPKNPYIRVRGLGLIKALQAPHFTREPKRHRDLRAIMKRTSGVAIALEDCTAFEIMESYYRILSSKKGAKAYRCYWKSGEYHQEIIPQLKEFSQIRKLLIK
jgi:dipeptidase E